MFNVHAWSGQNPCYLSQQDFSAAINFYHAEASRRVNPSGVDQKEDTYRKRQTGGLMLNFRGHFLVEVS